MTRILIVDDNEANLYYLKSLLSAHGFEVETAHHGAEALARAGLSTPDVIVSDLLMPVMDGYTLLRQCRTDARFSQVPFIVYTGTYTDQEDEALAIRLGADAFILKPAPPADFVARVRAVLTTRTVRPAPSPGGAEVSLQLYSEALVRRLEARSAALESANQELDHNQAFLRMASRISRLGAWSVDVPTLTHRWSDMVRDIHEWDRPGHPTLDELIAFYAQEDRAAMQAAVARCMADGTPFDLECGFITAKGRRLWVRALGEAERDIHGAVARIQGAFQDITQRREGEQRRRLHQAALDVASDGIVLTDRHGVVEWVNQAFVARYGYAPSELIGRPPGALLKSGMHDQRFYQDMWTTILDGRVWSGEITNRCRDGRHITEDLAITPIRDASGVLTHFIGIKRDITAQRTLEDQLRQSQKMEAIGQLAGGVAHDFNNILAVMMMQTELTDSLDGLPAEAHEGLKEIRTAAERAAALTRQLLMFSRRQVMRTIDVDLNDVVSGMTTMLRRLIGEDVQLTVSLHTSPLMTRADSSMLGQVLLNLVVNARDAMPHGGRLTITTAEVTVEAHSVQRPPDAAPGPYMSLTVADTGSGISADVLPHIFEPFFTTKERGKGTGLGLATVFGIVRQHGGWISVASTGGHGTTFQVFLPAATGAAAPAAVSEPGDTRGRGETVLVVEDEPAVRVLTRAILERAGYRVLEASTGAEALDEGRAHRADIALLVTDLVLPGGMNGQQVAAVLEAENPQLRVVFMSGYSGEIAGRELALKHGENFIQKPFHSDDLLRTIRRSLDG